MAAKPAFEREETGYRATCRDSVGRQEELCDPMVLIILVTMTIIVIVVALK